MLVQITEKGRNVGLGMFQAVEQYLDNYHKKYDSFDAMERNLHNDFKEEKKYCIENGIVNEKGEEYDFDEEKISLVMNSTKHCVIAFLNLCKIDGTSYKDTKKKIKLGVRHLNKMKKLPSGE